MPCLRPYPRGPGRPRTVTPVTVSLPDSGVAANSDPEAQNRAITGSGATRIVFAEDS
jgi:hypothetical protein